MKLTKLKISLILLIIFISNITIYSQTKIERLQEELFAYTDEHGNDTVALRKVKELYNATIDIDPLTASGFAAMGQQIAVELGDSIEYAIMLGHLGNSYIKQKTYFMALESHFNAFEIFSKYNDQKNIAYSLINIGNTYLAQEIYAIAEEKYKNALKIFNEINYPKGEVHALKQLGIVNLSIDEDFSLKYFASADSVLQNHNDPQLTAAIQINKAIALMQLSEIKPAIVNLNKAKNFYIKQNNKIKIAQVFFLIGEVFLSDEQYIPAKKNLEKSLVLFEELNAKEKISDIYSKLSDIYFQLEKYPKAVTFANRSLNIADTFGYLELQRDALHTLARSYQKLQDYKTAFQILDDYTEIVNLIYETKKQQQFSDFQMKLETQSKQNEIEFIQIKADKLELQTAHEQYKRNKLFGLIIGILIFIFIIFLFFRFREKNKSHKLLQEANIQLKTEIEDRKLAETKMILSEERYRLLFRKTPIGIMQFDEDLNITDVNDRFTQIFNIERSLVLNTELNTIFDRNSIYTFNKALNSKAKNFKEQTEIVTKGRVIFISMTIKPYTFNWQNEVRKGCIVIIEDLTDRKKAEKLYNKNIQKKQNLLNLFPDNLILLNSQNEILESHIPNSPDLEISCNHISEIIPKEAYQNFEDQITEARENNLYHKFLFHDNKANIKYLARLIPDNKDNMLVIINQFHAFSDDEKRIENKYIAHKTEKVNETVSKKDKYYSELRTEIENYLLPVYQNIQQKLSFIILKGFADKILLIGKKFNNIELINYGEELLQYITNFNVIKVNEILTKFPSLISEYISYQKFSL